MKICTKCNEDKPLERFPVNDFGKHVSTCKDCISKKVLAKYHENKKLNITLSELETKSA